MPDQITDARPPATVDTAAVEAATIDVLHGFAAVCGAPDDPAVAARADESLGRLRRLLLPEPRRTVRPGSPDAA